MALPALTSFAQVQAFFNDFISANNIQIQGAPHQDFWNNINTNDGFTTAYDSFVSGNVPNVQDGLGNPVKILASGNSAASNIIMVLKGTLAGFARMPFGGPYMSSDQIGQLAGWIDNNCPS
jgi:hypothetical protein